MQYIQYEFFTGNEIEQSWLVSILGDAGFDGFEETTQSLKAFVPASINAEIDVKQILAANEFQHIIFTSELIPEKNWNEEWEKNFEPVLIASRVGIRAPFHSPMGSEFELVIEPKMSFGTGHHATTAAVIGLMLDEDLSGRSVLDFGSGTGVLSILAEKLGASSVLAIDNELWACENCVENAERNNCHKIKGVHGDEKFVFTDKYDVILANINRHVILSNIANWSMLLNPHGLLIVSGILQADEQIVKEEASKNKLAVKKVTELNGWLAISFTHF
jgi:ribosomal protein L11 methyltransferase